MEQTSFSKISFYCSLANLALIFLIIIFIMIFPSPAVCAGLADIFMYISPIIGIIGLIFAFKGINEPNTWKKVFALIINIFVALFIFGWFQ